MKASDWKPVGQFVSKLQDLYAVSRDTFAEMDIGADIIPWLVGDGKKPFVAKLKELGTEFNGVWRVRLTNDKNVMYVNLDAPPRLPFDHAVIGSNAGGGWVKVEKRGDRLFVEGKRVVLYFPNRRGDGVVVPRFQEMFSNKHPEHPNLLDALFDFPHFVPKNWKCNARSIFFGAVVFQGGSSLNPILYVRGFSFDAGAVAGVGVWCSDYAGFDNKWSPHVAMAVRQN
ncbi:hypothetical protein KGQ34_01125 [Patescibacteria group bacterium]|nr:hypothetical protein [Patescibacteria group bacterium]